MYSGHPGRRPTAKKTYGVAKTTTIRILATLTRPDVGTARVLGHDVMSEADAIRACSPPSTSKRSTSSAHPRLRATIWNPVRPQRAAPPGQHAWLKAWCGETAVEFGRARVTTQDVLRALVDRLLSDEALAAAIRDDLGGVAISTSAAGHPGQCDRPARAERCRSGPVRMVSSLSGLGGQVAAGRARATRAATSMTPASARNATW